MDRQEWKQLKRGTRQHLRFNSIYERRWYIAALLAALLFALGPPLGMLRGASSAAKQPVQAAPIVVKK